MAINRVIIFGGFHNSLLKYILRGVLILLSLSILSNCHEERRKLINDLSVSINFENISETESFLSVLNQVRLKNGSRVVKVNADDISPCTQREQYNQAYQNQVNSTEFKTLVDNPLMMDVGPWRVIEYHEPSHLPVQERIKRGERLAMASILHIPTNVDHFGTDHNSLICVTKLWKYSFEKYGNMSGVDFVIVHDNLPPEHVQNLTAGGFKVVQVPTVAHGHWNDDYEFVRLGLLKVHLVNLVEYSRVLYTDIDVFAADSSSTRISRWLDYEFEESLVGSMVRGGFWGNIFVVRPSAYRFSKMMEWIGYGFSYSKGWNNHGLYIFPTPGPIPSCYEYSLRCEGYSEIKYIMDRCIKYRVSAWSTMDMGHSDQGIFYYSFNLSSDPAFSFRNLFYSEGYKYISSTPREFSAPHAYFHAAGSNKPWAGFCSKSSKNFNPKRCPVNIQTARFFFWKLYIDAKDLGILSSDSCGAMESLSLDPI
jgi:hypothetical protein